MTFKVGDIVEGVLPSMPLREWSSKGNISEVVDVTPFEVRVKLLSVSKRNANSYPNHLSYIGLVEWISADRFKLADVKRFDKFSYHKKRVEERHLKKKVN